MKLRCPKYGSGPHTAHKLTITKQTRTASVAGPRGRYKRLQALVKCSCGHEWWTRVAEATPKFAQPAAVKKARK